MTIKSIETRYAGCHFRSRLEARWAVFFDHLKIEWQYEPQGFETPFGGYLPDFWLPEGSAWIEIKGGTPSKRDLDRCEHVASSGAPDQKFRILVGDIPRYCPRYGAKGEPPLFFGLPIVGWSPTAIKAMTDAPSVTAKRLMAAASNPEAFDNALIEIEDIDILEYGWRDTHWVLSPHVAPTPESLDAALTAARSARFEHGQSGAR